MLGTSLRTFHRQARIFDLAVTSLPFLLSPINNSPKEKATVEEREKGIVEESVREEGMSDRS
jgi:hypothetical protein